MCFRSYSCNGKHRAGVVKFDVICTRDKYLRYDMKLRNSRIEYRLEYANKIVGVVKIDF